MKKSQTFFYNLPYESYEKKSSYEVEEVQYDVPECCRAQGNISLLFFFIMFDFIPNVWLIIGRL